MKLYGSTTSPYVRRLRLLLNDYPHEFIHLNIFESADRNTLIQHNPTRKIPMIVDNGQVIFDSNVIFRYLRDKLDLPAFSWEQENLLTTINSINDSLVELLLCSRSGFDVSEDRLFFNLQRERVDAILVVLENELKKGKFTTWDYLSIALYCLVDWILFRKLADLTPFPKLVEFHQKNKDQPGVVVSAPH